MAQTLSPVRRPWYSPGAIGQGLREVRRYPIVPLVIMFLVLVIPALFADLVVPHDPISSDLSHRLEPPAWVGPKVATRTVVETRQDRHAEITLEDARQLEVGTAVGETPSFDPNVALGDTVETVERPGGSWSRPLGTDKLGRDLLSRIIKGAQISLLVSVVVIVISGVVGTILGIMASYFGGWVDYAISRVIDVAMALPVILIALVLVVVVGPGLKVLVIVIAGVLWSRYARLVRGETLGIMSQDFINLARVAGSSHLYIMARHVFPNVFNSLIVLATLQVGYVIIIESALSFIGVGIPRPTPSWGSIVADGRDLIIQAAWWVSLFPGLAIVLTVLSVNLVGDWLRDRLDPKLRQI